MVAMIALTSVRSRADDSRKEDRGGRRRTEEEEGGGRGATTRREAVTFLRRPMTPDDAREAVATFLSARREGAPTPSVGVGSSAPRGATRRHLPLPPSLDNTTTTTTTTTTGKSNQIHPSRIQTTRSLEDGARHTVP